MSTGVLQRPWATRPAGARPSPRWGRWSLRGGAAVYLGGMVLLPLVAVVVTGSDNGLGALQSALAAPGAIAALRLTLVAATATAVLNAIFGTLLAYVLVRFRFPGRVLLSAIVDLPFAIPTLVTGVMLVALYGPASPIGSWLGNYGIEVAFAPLGVLLAMMFVTLPFVVRTVQPVLSELDPAEEEAAYSLGAGAFTTFRRVVLPALRSAIVAGSLLAFARALGEFGAIVVVSGNIPGTLTAPVYIFQLVSQFRFEEAAALATLLFAISGTVVVLTERLIIRRREEP
jgi:sulfate/thiosulfate transport system permease protein